jgi:hypothetical protein
MQAPVSYKIQAAQPYTQPPHAHEYQQSYIPQHQIYQPSYYEQTPNYQYNQPSYQQPPAHQQYEDEPILIEKEKIDTMNIVATGDAQKARNLFLMGFLFPLIWLINLRYRNSPNQKARTWWRWSLVMFILFIILSIVLGITLATTIKKRR